MSHPNPSSSSALMHLNEAEARAVEAFADRVIPSGDAGTGAREAGVVFYIDRALAGFASDMQELYAVGLRRLDDLCRVRLGAPFADLHDDDQDTVVRALLGAETPGTERSALIAPEDVPAPLPQLAAALRQHTVEGFFGDPMYGGNRDAIGWRLVGFPGAQWGYEPEQMAEGYDPSQIPVKTLSDLSREVRAGVPLPRAQGSA
jgi:gluconate 2-dehydrogenase gamma chain